MTQAQIRWCCILCDQIRSSQLKHETAAAAAHLGKFDGLGLGVVVVEAGDELTEEDVELLPAVAGDGAAHRPHQREEEQALQPQRYLQASNQTHKP